MAARFIFVVLFENTVVLVMICVRWLIPDQSASLRDQIRREAYITNEIVIKQETKRATENRNGGVRSSGKISQNNWNLLLSNKLTTSQLDLFIHDHTKPPSLDKTAQDMAKFVKAEGASSYNPVADNTNVMESKV